MPSIAIRHPYPAEYRTQEEAVTAFVRMYKGGMGPAEIEESLGWSPCKADWHEIVGKTWEAARAVGRTIQAEEVEDIPF